MFPFKVATRVEMHSRRLRRMRARILRSSNMLQHVGRTPYAYTLTHRDRGRTAWRSHEISRLLERLRLKFNRRPRNGRPLRYVWVAELQRDGTPHYHLILWDLPRLHLDTMGFWPHGMSRCDGSARNGAAYAVAYAGKLEKTQQKRDAFPRGLRISGSGGLTKTDLDNIRRASLPKWAQDMGGARRSARLGGRIISDDGDILRSPYYVARTGSVLKIYDCREFHDGPWQCQLVAHQHLLQKLFLDTLNPCFLRGDYVY